MYKLNIALYCHYTENAATLNRLNIKCIHMHTFLPFSWVNVKANESKWYFVVCSSPVFIELGFLRIYFWQ